MKLSPQELRQALHPGNFSRFVDERSADSEEIQFALGLKKPDFRMRDAELLLRYLAYKNFARSYRGNLKKFLDDATGTFNRSWNESRAMIEHQCDEMDKAFQFTRNIFGEENYLRKWNGQAFESRKNRAVFDIMLHYFSEPDVRRSLEGLGEQIVGRYIQLCNDNREFRSSIETTTKSLEANISRFNLWAHALEQVSNRKVESPFQQ